MTDPPRPDLRASDADRDRSVDVLRDAVVEGRLTLEEFSERVGHAQVARTEGELSRLVSDLPSAPARAAAAEAPTRYRAIFSKLVRSGPWELPADASFHSLCGTMLLDLRGARLHGDEVVMNVRNSFGTVTVVVPEGIAVSVEGGGWFSSEVVQPGMDAPLPGAPRLRIRLTGMGGSLYVRSHQPGDLRAQLQAAARAQLPG